MKKILEYGLGFICWLNAAASYAVDKFEVLPDLPDPLAAYAQSAEASTITGGNSIVGTSSIGHEPNIISVVFSLIIVVLLIYITGILYTKLNKAGLNALKKQQGSLAKLHATVVSTTALGNNKTLHVVELDGKRMLIGASSGAIQLIKDLGSVSKDEAEEEFSSIEIPTIKIPKIEIPKIEIPSIGFSKLATKIHKEMEKNKEEQESENEVDTVTKAEETENPDGIIDTLFNEHKETMAEDSEPETNPAAEHMVDPDDFALYKKYLG